MKCSLRRLSVVISVVMLLALLPASALADAASDAFILAVTNKQSAISINSAVETSCNLTVDAGTTITIDPISGSWTVLGGTIKVFGTISGAVAGTVERYIPVSSLGNWSGSIASIAYLGFTDGSSTRDIVDHNGSSYVAASLSGKSINVVETAGGSVYKLASAGTLSESHQIIYVDPDTSNIIPSLVPSEFIEADGAVLPTSVSFTKTGYTFLGWSQNPASTNADLTTIPIGTTVPVTAYAIWQADSPGSGTAGGAMSGFGGITIGRSSGSVGGSSSMSTSDDEDDEDTASIAPTQAPSTQQARVVQANSSTKVSFANGSSGTMELPQRVSKAQDGLPILSILLLSALAVGGGVYGVIRYRKYALRRDLEESSDDLEDSGIL